MGYGPKMDHLAKLYHAALFLLAEPLAIEMSSARLRLQRFMRVLRFRGDMDGPIAEGDEDCEGTPHHRTSTMFQIVSLRSPRQTICVVYIYLLL